MRDTTPRDRAIAALNEKFDCGSGVIGLGTPELEHLTATKATGPDLFDWQKLTLGEIVDCLADAGLLADSAPVEMAELSGALWHTSFQAMKAQHDALVQRLREQDQRVVLAGTVHPGEILREELQARGLTQSACAEMAGRSGTVISLIINGKKSITPDTALDLERGLGISAEFWVRAQADHDLRVARQRRAVPR